MSDAYPTDPSLRRLERDLVSADFDAGVAAGRWRVIGLAWPDITVAVAAGGDRELGMRIQVDGYPAAAPGGQPWDLETDQPLPMNRWPTGGPPPLMFNPGWSPSYDNAPYVACDRGGLRAHPDWQTRHPEQAWNPTRTIAFYLEEIHRRLLGSDLPAGA